MATPDEIAAEAAKATAEAEAKKKADQDKKWDNSEVQKIIAERQEAKERVRKFEEAEAKAQAKAKKEADEKAIAEGNMKSVLEQTQAELAANKKQIEAYNAKEKLRREEALTKLTDPKVKLIAEAITDNDRLLDFVELHTTQKLNTYNGKGKPGAPDIEEEKKMRPGENWNQYSARMRLAGFAM